jgi:hypothetical protein
VFDGARRRYRDQEGRIEHHLVHFLHVLEEHHMWRLHPEAETEGFALELHQRRFSTAMVRKHPSVPR